MTEDRLPAAPRLVAWRRTDEGQGHSLARLEHVEDGWSGHASEVLVAATELVACSFAVRLGPDWVTREVEVTAVSRLGRRELGLTADPDRRWWADGRRRPDLDGCLDVDVAATPFTNTFPIRRLATLAVGAAVTTAVAWVDVPALVVSRVDQTYRRLEPRRWEYRDDAHGAFVLTVDEDGLVLDYEGFAARVRG